MKRVKLEAIIITALLFALLSVLPVPTRVEGRPRGFPPQGVVIGDLLYDGYASGDKDESFSLWNVGASPVSLNGWHATDGEGSVDLSPVTIPPQSKVWMAKEATAFETTFGFPPDYEYGSDTDPAVPDLSKSGRFSFGNTGDELSITDASGDLVDAVCYRNGHLDRGWQGEPLQPYTAGGLFRKSNQLMSRKLSLGTPIIPLGDTDTAADWVQDPVDPLLGRRPLYPGWSREKFWIPAKATGGVSMTIAVAPDSTMQQISHVVSGAQHCVCYEGYTLESTAMANMLSQKAGAGVQVTILLEGGPVGGISELEKWCAQKVESGGGRVYFMVNDRNGAHARYRFVHSKLLIVDDSTVGIGTENLAVGGLPEDALNNGTGGSRGVWIFTDAAPLVSRAKEIWNDDFDPSREDIYRWNASDAKYGPPPSDYTPPPPFDWEVYQVRFPQARDVHASEVELVTAPDATLRPDGILKILDSAGPGDEILMEYLEQQPHWGKSSSSQQIDPNVYLEHMVNAAKRGAKVRVLLDSFFDNPSSSMSNRASAEYLNGLASQEHLDLMAKSGNPAWQGLHNKMIIASIGGKGWLAIGSLNGSEVSCKDNRETILIAQSDEGYDLLKEVFEQDWSNPNYWNDGTDP